LPEPTEAELRGLRAPTVAARSRAVDRMFERQPTPDMAREVATAARTTRDTGIRRKLDCLRAWAGDVDALVAGIARLPDDAGGYGKGLDPTQRCLLDVVSRRAAEAPAPAAEALAVIALAGTDAEQEKARAGLARTGVDARPRAIESALQSEDAGERARAYRAALALGALARDPALVEACLADAEASAACRDEALAAPAAMRLLAGAIAGQEEDEHLWALVEERGLADDLWPALVGVARDRERPAEERTRALELLADAGDPAVAVDLAPMVGETGDPLAAQARRTLAALQRRRLSASQ
jgi:hypothetical protein